MSDNDDEYPDEYLDENGNEYPKEEPEQKRGELKPCPFCGEPVEFNKFAEKVVCEDCGATIYSDYWNTHPIEDALNARIAELEAHIAALEEAAEIEEWDDFPNFPEPPEVRE